MRASSILTLSLALALTTACSRDWKADDDTGGSDDTGGPEVGDGGDDPGADGEDGGDTDGGATDGGASDGGAGDGGSDETTDADGDGFSEDDGDCDDSDDSVYPGAEELCDGKLNDCDGAMLDGETTDADGDTVLDCSDFCPVQVAAGSSGDGSFANPVGTVQSGIDIAATVSCTEVDVWPGSYSETVDYNGHDIDVRSTDGAEATTIDAGSASSAVTLSTGEGSGAMLRGFTVTGGSAERGGGVHIDGASPVISDNIISGNTATGGSNLGGGIYLYESDAQVLDNLIQGNSAGLGGDDDGNDGGGIAIAYGAPTIQGNQILDNEAGDGGGIWAVRTDAVIVHNLIDGNTAQDSGNEDDLGYVLGGQGGGVDLQTDTVDVVLSNNILSNNHASTHGGGLALIGFYSTDDVADATVQNNVIAFNSVPSGGYGGGVVVWGYSAPDLRNNLVFDNAVSGLYLQYSYATPAYNAVVDNDSNWAGEPGDLTGTDGNFASGPGVRAQSDDGDFSNDVWVLSSSSVLEDAGDPSILDVDGSRSDVGAYGGPDGSW